MIGVSATLSHAARSMTVARVGGGKVPRGRTSALAAVWLVPNSLLRPPVTGPWPQGDPCPGEIGLHAPLGAAGDELDVECREAQLLVQRAQQLRAQALSSGRPGLPPRRNAGLDEGVVHFAILLELLETDGSVAGVLPAVAPGAP